MTRSRTKLEGAGFKVLALSMVVAVVSVVTGCAQTAPGEQGEQEMSTTMESFRYGFRYDPMEWVENDRSVQGAQVRAFVFRRPLEGDEHILQKRIDELLAGQFEDGALSDDEHHRMQFTAQRLIELAELGCDPERPEVKRAVAALLGGPSDEGSDTLGIYAVRALCLLGITESPKVAAGLRDCVEREAEWNGPYKGCPWTPIVHLETLWGGRGLYEVEALVTECLSWIAGDLNQAGCLSYKDPWGFVKMSGVVDHRLAGKIAEGEVPMLLRAQRPDGGWGERSFRVFRSLVKHDVLDRLRGLPALPPDWMIVRSIPAPRDGLFTMTWDGEHLWVYDRKANKALALSADDGTVLKTVELPVENVFGIGWWDNALAVTQTDPKRLLKVDPDTGEVQQEISLGDMDEVLGVAQVDGKMVVGDGFMCSTCVLDPVDPGDRRWQTLAGPGPISLTAEGGALWHFDFWAPAIIKSDLSGRLLDWGEKPFDGSVNGLAWDGTQLWALDAKTQRICVIEKVRHLETR